MITVNLTSMLVLTARPPTWLLFNLLYPFIVVLLHTYMDTLRSDEEREINHHGKTITINNDEEEENPNTIMVSISLML